MAQYWEDWSGSTIGQEPSGWTKRWVTSGVTYTVQADAAAPAGKRLRISRSSTARSGISMDAVTPSATVSVRALVRFSGTPGIQSKTFCGLLGRGGGASASETGVVCAVGTETDTQLRNLEYNGGALNFPDRSTAGWETDTLYWLGLDADGSSLINSIALEATPSTPLVTPLGSTVSVTSSGFAGLFIANATVTMDVLAIGIGTDGDPAPTSAPGGEHALEGAATVSVSASADLTTAGPAPVKGVRVQLHAKDKTPRANVTDITALYWDASAPSGSPDLETNTASTDGSGYLTLDVDAVTALEVGGEGILQLYKAGANAQTDISVLTRVTIEDIA